MDRQIQAALPQYERFVRRFRAPSWVRSRLALDDEDIHNDCRYTALKAIETFRLRYPEKAGTVDEIKWVQRSIAHAFMDVLRKANRLQRCMDETAESTIHAGNAPWMPKAGQTLEDEYLDAEREKAVRRACELVREIVGAEVFADLLRSADGERIVGRPRREGLRASDRRRRAIQRARQQLTALSIGEVVKEFGGSMQDEGRAPSTLTDEELPRVALYFKEQHGTKVANLERAHLLGKVEAVNTVVDPDTQKSVVYAFPPCFASKQHYDPKSTECSPESKGDDACDYRGECRAALGLNPEIETELVQLRSRLADKKKEDVEPPKKETKASKKKEPALVLDPPKKEETMVKSEQKDPTSLEVGQVFLDNDKRTEGKRKVIVVELEPGGVRAKILDPAKKTTSTIAAGNFFKTGGKGFAFAGVLTGKELDLALIVAGMKHVVDDGNGKAAVEAPSPTLLQAATKIVGESAAKNAKGRERPAVVAKGSGSKPAKTSAPAAVKEPAAKETKPKKEKAKKEKRPAVTAPIHLSTRKSIPVKSKKIDPRTGKPWVRLPQGSAAELAKLPVGHRIQRVYATPQGDFVFHVRKLKDGPEREGPDGIKRKRDGVWVLEWKAPVARQEDGSWSTPKKEERQEIQGVEGSLGVITRFITKSNVWSAAKFFNVVPDALNPHKESFAPERYKPQSVYAYGHADPRPKKKQKKNGKVKKKAKKG